MIYRLKFFFELISDDWGGDRAQSELSENWFANKLPQIKRSIFIDDHICITRKYNLDIELSDKISRNNAINDQQETLTNITCLYVIFANLTMTKSEVSRSYLFELSRFLSEMNGISARSVMAKRIWNSEWTIFRWYMSMWLFYRINNCRLIIYRLTPFWFSKTRVQFSNNFRYKVALIYVFNNKIIEINRENCWNIKFI